MFKNSNYYYLKLKAKVINGLGAKCYHEPCLGDVNQDPLELRIVPLNQLRVGRRCRTYTTINQRYRQVLEHPEIYRLLCPICYNASRVNPRSHAYSRHKRHKPKFIGGKFVAGSLEIPYQVVNI